jgi:hypothetical protein
MLLPSTATKKFPATPVQNGISAFKKINALLLSHGEYPHLAAGI